MRVWTRSTLGGTFTRFARSATGWAWLPTSASRFAHPHAVNDTDLVDLLGGVARVGLNLLGVVTALGTAGVNVSGLVAGVGLTRLAMGFAFRDVLAVC